MPQSADSRVLSAEQVAEIAARHVNHLSALQSGMWCPVCGESYGPCDVARLAASHEVLRAELEEESATS